MITVRFPSGFSVQYNAGCKITRLGSGGAAISDKTRGWLADAPAGAIVEGWPPCRTYNPIAEQRDSDRQRIALLETELRDARRKLREAKKAGRK